VNDFLSPMLFKTKLDAGKCGVDLPRVELQGNCPSDLANEVACTERSETAVFLRDRKCFRVTKNGQSCYSYGNASRTNQVDKRSELVSEIDLALV
jgi:hypothetical protein